MHCLWKVSSCRCCQVPGYAMGLLHEVARVLHKGLPVPVVLYSSETKIWREKMEVCWVSGECIEGRMQR